MILCVKCGEQPAMAENMVFCADCQSVMDATRAPPLPPRAGMSEAAKARAAMADMQIEGRQESPERSEPMTPSERVERIRGGLDTAAVLIASAQKVGNVETKSDLVRAVLKGAMVDDVDAAIRALVEVLRCLAPERVEGV